jgi:hypothetical protein
MIEKQGIDRSTIDRSINQLPDRRLSITSRTPHIQHATPTHAPTHPRTTALFCRKTRTLSSSSDARSLAASASSPPSPPPPPRPRCRARAVYVVVVINRIGHGYLHIVIAQSSS